MSRQVIKWFLIWVFLAVIPVTVYVWYSSGVFLWDREFLQGMILESFAVLNFIYLVLLINKIDLVYGLSFGVVFWLAASVYLHFSRNVETRTQFLQILIVEVVITIIVRLVMKKRSLPR